MYGGTIPPQANGTVVQYYVSAEDDSSAVTTDPADAPGVTYSYSVGYTSPSLFVNEFMADNDNTLQDEAGEFDDWIEMYNGGSTGIDLGGMYLTDDLTNPDKWPIPATLVGAGEVLLFWADEDQEQGPLHTNFKLGKGGEVLAIVDTDGISIVDSVTFGEQTTDVSYGRHPDGWGAWQLFEDPTPGERNAHIEGGDVNGDGQTNVLDVLAVVNHILVLEPLTGDQLSLADCTSDGQINVLDALGIVNVILGIGGCE